MQRGGVLVRRSGANVILAPPLVITAEETDAAAETLLKALTSTDVLAA
ncbi:hypothetical protein [Nocardiopsis sp. CNR-923]|nr:hypothetical protein [Nocardiopsis sp. CNR-923]